MKLLITNKANQKLEAFVGLVETEISGMAKSNRNKDGDIVITDFIIFDQEVTGGSTIITDESQARFLNELMKKDADTKEWNVWWHSHCDLGVFWSATDDATIEEHTGQSYLISLVTNKAKKMKARLDLYPKDTSPFDIKTHAQIDIDEDDIEIYQTEAEQKEEEKYEKEVEKLDVEFNKKLEKIEKKYSVKDNKATKTFCQKEINKKVKTKVYEIERNKNHGFVNNQSKHQKEPKKKWNWFDGIIVDLKEEDDYFDKQIGFRFSK